MSTYHSYISTLDAASNSNVLDYSPLMFAKPKPGGDIALWPLLQKTSDLTDTVAYWMESSLVPMTFTADTDNYLSTASGSDVTLDTASGQGASRFLSAGSLIRDTASGKDEVCLVTNVSTDALTVTRNWNGLGLETHASGATWEVIGHLNYESSAFGTTVGRTPTRKSNYTNILDVQVKQSGTDMARNYYSIPDYWEWNVAGAVERFQRQMERMTIYSAGVARSDTVNVYGSMSGIKDMIYDNNATTNYDASFGAFSYASWDDVIKTLWSSGYADGRYVMLLPPAGLQQCAYIHESAFRGDYRGELVRGLRATALQSTLGPEIPLIPSSALQNDEFLLLDLSRIKVRFMVGRELVAMEIPHGNDGNDYRARRLLSEFSLEMHNVADAHFWARGVTFSVPS